MGLRRRLSRLWDETIDGVLTGPGIDVGSINADEATINQSVTYPDGSVVESSPDPYGTVQRDSPYYRHQSFDGVTTASSGGQTGLGELRSGGTAEDYAKAQTDGGVTGLNTGIGDATWEQNRYMKCIATPFNGSEPLYLVTGRVSETDKTLPHVGFLIDAGTLKATVGDGASQTTHTFGGISSYHEMRADYQVDSVEFVVDGPDVSATATIIDGLPSGTAESEWMMTLLADNVNGSGDRLRYDYFEVAQANIRV